MGPEQSAVFISVAQAVGAGCPMLWKVVEARLTRSRKLPLLLSRRLFAGIIILALGKDDSNILD